MAPKLTPDQRKIIQEANLLLPFPVMMRLKNTFTPRGLLFFQFYLDLKTYELGFPVPPDLRLIFTRAANYLSQITSPVDHRPLSPTVINHLSESRTEMAMLLNRLVNGKLDDNSTWGKINDVMVPVIKEAARDKGIYLATRQVGPRRWSIFRRMSPSQSQIEKLKDDDPETYDIVQRYHKTLKDIDTTIEETIRKSGLTPEKAFIAGSPVTVAADPVTGEKSVYDRDGAVIPIPDYIQKRRDRMEEQARLALVPHKTQIPPSDLRRISDEELEKLPGDIRMASLTDDKAKQGKLTRIFAVKQKPVFINTPDGETKIEARTVIANGRFKGVFLDDMVNGEGRMIEGTAYSYNPITGREGNMPVHIDPAQREPYVTTAVIPTTYRTKGKIVKHNVTRLFVKIPSDRKYKNVRKQLKTLSCNTYMSEMKDCLSSVVWDEHRGHASGFYFDPKDFGLINEVLQGLSLSSSALAIIKNYYKELSRAETATADKNLTHYSTNQLGGFVTHMKNGRPFDLLSVQKKFLAWMDANGNKGVCALDTGIGKTLSAISAMKKMNRDGQGDPDAEYTTPTGRKVKTNGRYLYVCPPALRGGFGADARKFLQDPKILLSQVDIMSYLTFGSASRRGKWKGNPWNPEAYVAIFFDESQELLSIGSGKSQAALRLWHPRKVCMTASPMEKNPMEAYIMAAISNNTVLHGRTPEARANRAEMRRFKERYCEVIGGRIVGVKQDPLTKRELQTWVRRNIYYADKRDVEEFKLPTLTADTTTVEMHPQVETAYRTVTTEFANIMGGMVAKFRDRGKSTNPSAPSAEDRAIEQAFGNKFKPIIRLLNDLSNAPDKALRTIAKIIETDSLDSTTGPKPIPDFMMPLVKAWKANLNPDTLRMTASSIPNPKLDAAEQKVRAKLDRTNGSSRTIFYTDDKEMCMRTVDRMSKTIAGQHAVGLPNSIHIFDGTGEIKEIVFEIDPIVLEKLVRDPLEQDRILQETGGVSRHKLPFVKRSMRKYPELPAGKGNQRFKTDQWQQFVLNEVVSPNRNIRTLTLYGPVYSLGQNLQAFDTVIHLDRDTWNAEMMKQRTARAWRQGQSQPVDEVTIDSIYGATKNGQTIMDEFDKTLDEIRGYFQEMDSEIFQRIIHDSMGAELGVEWEAIKKYTASGYRLDRRTMDLMTSPYAGRSEVPGNR